MEGDPLVIVDTHAWIWWVSAPDKLSAPARARMDRATAIGVCAISCWEVSMLAAKGRLQLDRNVLEWIDDALRGARTRLVPLEPAIAVGATRFGREVPLDPADCIILASAAYLDAPLVTRDRALRATREVETVW